MRSRLGEREPAQRGGQGLGKEQRGRPRTLSGPAVERLDRPFEPLVVMRDQLTRPAGGILDRPEVTGEREPRLQLGDPLEERR